MLRASGKRPPGTWTGKSATPITPPPRPGAEALAKRPEREFPFKKDTVVFGRTVDGKAVLRIPLGADEKLYGFGLQLDGQDKTGTVLTLNVDHWSTGGGRTHAPVPFYISSRGYGVFINTARFLKVYAGIGNRKDAPGNPAAVDRNPPAGDRRFPWSDRPRADAVEALVDGPGAEIVVFAGETIADVVARYNLFCGGGALPPLWGLGFWHRVPAEAGAEDVRKEVAAFAAHEMPLDVIGLEPGWMTKSYPCTFEWQKKRFPNPAALGRRAAQEGHPPEPLGKSLRLPGKPPLQDALSSLGLPYGLARASCPTTPCPKPGRPSWPSTERTTWTSASAATRSTKWTATTSGCGPTTPNSPRARRARSCARPTAS